MFEFEKENKKSMKGTQATKYDSLYKEFTEGGDVLYFDEEKVSRPTAANIARRMNKLAKIESDNDPFSDTQKKFHSGFDVLKKKTFVRLRTEDEVATQEEEYNEE